MNVRRRQLLCLSSLLLAAGACALGGCGRTSAPASRRGASLESGVAARVGGDVVTVAELDRHIAPELFELRSTVLRAVLVSKLVKRESERRNMSADDLRAAEVDNKVARPSAEDAARTVEEWVKGGRLSAADASKMTLEQRAHRVQQFRLRAREEAYYDELFQASAVQIDFGALGKPELKVSATGPSLGFSKAAIKVYEFSDLTQSFTSLWQPTLEKLVDKYRDNVQFIFKQKPGAPDSPGAKLAEAALCANEQGRYWDYRRALLAKAAETRAGAALVAASEAKLDVGAFEKCLAAGSHRAAVSRDMGEAMANRLEGEPVLSINGIVLTGAQPFESVDRVLKIEMTGTLHGTASRR